jgi:hypothetical protein
LSIFNPKKFLMQPLIIIATPNICGLNLEVEYPKTPEAIAEEACQCHAAGATILHTHAERKWEETIAAIRARSWHALCATVCGFEWKGGSNGTR